MVVNMLKNWNSINYHYFIKFVGFIPIYNAIKLNIISSYMIFNYLYIGFIDFIVSLNK